MLPEWDQKYSINNEKIDEQHKKLFELAFKFQIDQFIKSNLKR